MIHLSSTDAPPMQDESSPNAAQQTSISTEVAQPRVRRLALAVTMASLLGFLIALPFSRSSLPGIPAFIPLSGAALAINDLISAVLLFGQFLQARRRALLALASGYLFSGLIIIPHMLTFPGAFTEGRLFGGSQTAVWLYIIWHGGFPACVLAYAILSRGEDAGGAHYRRPGGIVTYAVLAVVASVVVFTLAATLGHDYLPVIVNARDNAGFFSKGITPAIVAISLMAIVILWRQPKPAVLDVWMMVVLCAWVFDVVLSTFIGSSRYDLGWYAGRLYAVLAATFVLIVLLLETVGLHGRLAAANDALARNASTLRARIRERTKDLSDANEALRQEIKQRQETQAQLAHSQKMDAIGNLTGGMAHDFNNLLAIIIGNLDLLRDRPATTQDPVAAELTGEALDAGLRGADLTRGLLAFARRQPLRPERTDLNELVTGITKLLERTLGEQIDISLEPGTGIWPVMVDPAQLEASLVNLATNARDAMPDGGSLTIVTANRHLDEDYASQHAELRPGDYVLLEVADTGSGIAPEILNRIFEPFFTTKEEGKGTGLGLSMVFGFMKQSGGHINVYSEIGIGTTFRLYLPRADVRAEIAVSETAQPTVRGRGETILVVEDKASLRRVVVRQLTELGYRVLEAENAQAALDVLDGDRADLVFTDVVMPGGTSGYELARILRVRRPGIKTLLTSGFPDARPDRNGAASDIRLLSKPYRRDELARVIREVLEKE